MTFAVLNPRPTHTTLAMIQACNDLVHQDVTPELIQQLASIGALTARDVRMGAKSPKLSKLRQIGKHAVLLRCHAESLSADYSILYHAVLLWKADKTGSRLREILSSGPVTRQMLMDAAQPQPE